PAVGGELGKVAGPQRILVLEPDDEIVACPEIALAVYHELARRTQTAAGEFERQDPGTRGPGQVGHEGSWPQVLALGDGVKVLKELEQPLGLVAGIASHPL